MEKRKRKGINTRKKHSMAVKEVIKDLLKKGAKKIYVNVKKNPHLKEWVKRHPRLEEME